MVRASLATTDPQTELYNSGASWHLSPYKADFSSYTPLSPHLYLNTANQIKFPAISMGTLVIQAPNNGHEPKLMLHNMLHAPSVSYILVSLGALDKQGYTFCISHRYLQIISLHREQLAQVMCNACCLYKVKHLLESAHVAKSLLAMELHCHLGHISITSIHKLVESGAIHGIKLDPNLPEVDCEACIIACTTRLPISKPRTSTPPRTLVTRSTLMCGDHYLAQPSRDDAILSLLWMIPLITPLSTCSVRKVKSSRPTNFSRRGQSPSNTAPKSRCCARTAEANTLARNSTSTSQQLVPHEGLQCMIPCS